MTVQEKRSSSAAFQNKALETLILWGWQRSIFLEKRSKIAAKKIIFLLDDEKDIEEIIQLGYQKEEVIVLKDNFELQLKELAWKLVFLKVELISLNDESARFLKIKEAFDSFQVGVQLTASNYSDFGYLFFKNIFNNLFRLKEYYLIDNFKDMFANTAAFIIGAGPSLPKDSELLQKIKNKGVVLAGGHALAALSKKNILPHMGAIIDKDQMYNNLQKDFYELPIWFAPQVAKENLKYFNKEKIFISEVDNYPLEKWLFKKLNIKQSSINTGWNVSCLLINIAKFLGCSPIILVGVDLCFQDVKYAYGKNVKSNDEKELLEVENRNNQKVYTQADWLLAKMWIEEFAQKENVKIINTSAFGLDLKGIEYQEMENLIAGIENVAVKADFSNLSAQLLDKEILAQVFQNLQNSILNCDALCDDILFHLQEVYEKKETLTIDPLAKLEKELFFLYHLKAMWEVWRHIIVRQFSANDIFVYKLNQVLFYKKITQDYLRLFKEISDNHVRRVLRNKR